MCGIGGMIGQRVNSIDPLVFSSTVANQLRHRGPDGAAYYSDEHAVLVHTRLSIIDLQGGTQPIHNHDKTVWVTFNGEIFNFIELREELESLGHVFYTRSDTEVIVHLYDRYGKDFVSYLNGQFAIALWDKKKKLAILCRDRVGIAPLFYKRDASALLFSSEIKGLLAMGNHAPEANLDAIDQILTFWSPVSPNTPFINIFEVKPGEMLLFDSEKSSLVSNLYWDYPFPNQGEGEIDNELEARQKIKSLLEDAVRIRLRSDVPVGAYLSGGLDSSILTALICDQQKQNLKTFSLTFEETELDETQHQQAMVKHLETQHEEVLCRYEDIATNFLDCIFHTESPIVRTAPIPMGMLSGLARKNDHKVVLTGEGADEVFGGYDLFKETKLREFWSRNPDSEWRPTLIRRLYPYLDLSQGRANTFLKAFFGSRVDNPQHPLFSHLPRIATTSKIKLFYSDDTKSHLSQDPLSLLEQSLPPSYQKWRLFNKALYLESKTLMAGYLLNSQGDRMLMKNSVEGRFPFLDHRLIEYAATLHPKLKMKGFREKYILKKAMKDYVPESIINRYKQPYRAPNIPSFFGATTPEYVNDLLDIKRVDQYGYYSGKKTALLVKKIKSGKAISYKDNMALVSILSTQAWHYHFFERFHDNFRIDNSRKVTIKRIH